MCLKISRWNDPWTQKLQFDIHSMIGHVIYTSIIRDIMSADKKESYLRWVDNVKFRISFQALSIQRPIWTCLMLHVSFERIDLLREGKSPKDGHRVGIGPIKGCEWWEHPLYWKWVMWLLRSTHKRSSWSCIYAASYMRLEVQWVIDSERFHTQKLSCRTYQIPKKSYSCE